MKRCTSTSTEVGRLGVLGLALAAVAMPASAQIGQTGLEEVVVTARKREESVQDSPVAVSAFTGEALEFRGVTSIDKVSNFTPNLVLAKSPTNSGVTNAQVFIRGIGQNDFVPVIDPGVGIYVDGVYLGRSVGGVLDLQDVERVEVLRGPQGTLFGRNNIGGAVSLTTNKPQDSFGGSVGVRFGTDSRIDVRGTVNVPFTDNFFGRFSAASLNQDGYVERVSDGLDLGNDDTIVTRAAFRWLANEDFEANFSVDYSRDRENGPAQVTTGIQPLNAGFAAGGAPSMVLAQNTIAAQLANGGIAPGGTFFDPAQPFPFNFMACFSPANVNNPACYNQRYIDDGSKERNFGTDPSYANLDTWGTALTLDYSISDALAVKSITAYRTFEGEFSADQDAGPQRLSWLIDIYQQKQVSQELQLLGTSFDDKVDWILGYYYFWEDGKNINPVRFSQVDLQSGGYFEAESWAVFGQATWHATDKLDLTVGVRYTEDTRDYLPDQFFEALPIGPLPLNCPPLPPGSAFNPALPVCAPGDRVLPFTTVTQETQEPVPMVNIAYTWMEGFMTYFTYSEGFKSGGFTQRIFPPEQSLPGFDPEFVTSYEGGFKFDGFDNRVRLNTAVFFTDYSDMQLLVADPSRVGPFVTNAGDAEIWGVEFELTVVPADGWLITASAGLTDPERTELAGNVQGLTLDSRFEHISEWMSNAQIEKEFHLGDWGYLTPRFEWSYRSGYGTNSNNVPREGAPTVPFFGNLGFGVPNPALYQDGFSLFNVSMRWDVKDSGFSIAGGVDNLTDKEYRLFGNFQDSFGWTNEAYDRGRQWYINMNYRF